MAHSTWQKAMDFDRDVLSALAEIEQLSKLVTFFKLLNVHLNKRNSLIRATVHV